MRYIIPTAALAAAMILVSCHKKETRTEETPEVEVSTPQIDSITLYKTLPGVINASATVNVSGRVNGRLLKIHYASGQYVKEGQLLFTMESTSYRDAVAKAEAALESAQSQYAYYSKQYEAMKKALAADAVSQMEVIEAENSMKNAEASISEAKAALSTARTNLGYCNITAPVSGHITDAIYSAGNVISGEGAPVTMATIYDDSRVKAVFELADTQYEELVGGNMGARDKIYRSIPLKFEQDLSGNYTADLTYTSPNVDQATGTLTLFGMVDNSRNELKPGMFVSVSLPYGTRPRAILINDGSIGTDQLGKYVYVVNDSNKVVYTPVEVGDLYQDTLRVVNKGLTEKSRYVTKALLTVHSGETVKPVERK